MSSPYVLAWLWGWLYPGNGRRAASRTARGRCTLCGHPRAQHWASRGDLLCGHCPRGRCRYRQGA